MAPDGAEWKRPENLVARTALWIAAERRDTDPYSEYFLQAAGEYESYRGSIFTARTAFFDKHIGGMGRDFKQIVLLGAGLDTRGLRFPLGAATTVYELDLPVMLDFKGAALLRVPPALRPPEARAATLRVPCDFERAGWKEELRRTRFDPAVPTLWAAEGLVFYLTDQAVQRLLGAVQELSAPGSALLFDCLSRSFARGLTSEPGHHWGVDSPADLVSRYGFQVAGDPSVGGDRFFVVAHRRAKHEL